MKNFKFSLAWQILIALILGIVVGAVLHNQPEIKDSIVNNVLTPLGKIFISLIKMIVIPIVFSTLILGIAGVGSTKSLGRLGFKTILYFEIITTIAILVGLVAANIFHPGSGIDMSQLVQTDISQYKHTTEEVQSQSHGIIQTILSLIPTNIISSMAHGEMLPVIFFAVLFGIGLSSLPATTKDPLLNVFHAVSETMFRVTHIIMKYAPVGVFGLIAVTVANFGFASLIPLGKLVVLVYGAILFFALVVLGLTAKMFSINIFTLFKILKDELILAYSTASSETVLPRIMQKMEAYGAPKAISSFVIPTGYSFNLDGSTLYQSIAAIFIAQLYGIEMSISQQVILVVTLMITSKGIAGVDRIMDMARTALNVVGNALAVLVISKWEKQYDYEKAAAYEATFK
ncbi:MULTISPECIES: glutamate/aspartate:proton symporter GltP [unclassified Acinetobacter]|uniref:glutamate/aspartate:proton symporter GltP n=1 Tax=unclassified Acinetobacter TaxID=196816 RepID=UPI001250339A|nr:MULTISPECIES: glutamate/aspartate:proton symporter GltP [unclassified Acinetobacter]